MRPSSKLAALVAVLTAVSILTAAPTAVRAADKAKPAANAPKGKPMANAGLTAKVKTALLADKVAPGLKIDVDSNAGVVTLNGKVDTNAQKIQAEKVAQKVKGVTKVVNKLTVKPPKTVPPKKK